MNGRKNIKMVEHVIRRKFFACWINKATDTQSEYVILTTFFTATMVTQMLLNVTYSTVPLCLSVCLSLSLSIFLFTTTTACTLFI